MLILVTGDRNWNDEQCIYDALASYQGDHTLIHGAARGADTIATNAAKLLGWGIVAFPANWAAYGRAAGPLRNQEMLETGPDLVIAFHPDLTKSKGTRDMVTRARRAGIRVIHYTGRN